MVHMLFKLIDKIFPAKLAYAHCDIPCGIYTLQPALTAADTVIKMAEKITALAHPQGSDEASHKEFHNALIRYVLVKEEHARICKHELLILWTDYFKQEHLKIFPDLHEKFWNAAKLCSKVKQGVNVETAKELKAAVEEIAGMFEKSRSH